MTETATRTEFTVTDTETSMDPHLQWAVSNRKRGFLRSATASSAPSEISVIAKVRNAVKWHGLSEVRNPMTIASQDAEDETTIVTGRVPLDRIEFIRELDFVESLKAAQPVQLTLAAGIAETSARPDLLPPDTLANGGEGVVVGVIDYGCDYAHRNFRDGAGRTRIEAIWHQAGARIPTSTAVSYGREYTAAEINAALALADPYAALGYAPDLDTPNSVGTHGTHVMDIAAGNGFGSGVAGFAPNATLIFVDVSHADIPFSGPSVVETSFGDSVMLLEAVQYIFDKAGDRPCVVNISLGTNGGPHDGSTLVEDGIDRLLSEAPNRAVTIAASNSHKDGIHAAGQIAQDGFIDLIWRVPTNDFSHNELDVWYPGSDAFDVELIDPSGNSLGTIPAGSNGQLLDAAGNVEIFAANRLRDPNNGDNQIGIFLEDTVASGAWTVRLLGRSVTDGNFHAWIERDNAAPSSFAPPHDNSHTIGSISCGRNTIVVGSYDAHKSEKPISWFSSEGPTRDGRRKPEVSAPGHAVEAAHSRTRTGVVSKSGTSMAAPAMAGIISLIFAEARKQGTDLTITELHDVIAASVNSSPPTPSGGWDARYGRGRIDAAKAIGEIHKRSPAPLVASAGKTRSTPRKKKT
ncbi:S8 family serine peptidase [Sedimentitalea sp. XS_ASV28]|uniref:S8 family serine peptidase n=1 Tax=Sedimentitalea sp. XS_ASV28 TaxID=3241296 RepID=UPI0035140212